MLTIPLVILLGFLAFGLVRWGKQSASGVVVGALFGLALAATAAGPPILRGFTAFSAAIFGALGSAVGR